MARTWAMRHVEGLTSTDFHKDGRTSIGWGDVGDLNEVRDVVELSALLRERYPDEDDEAIVSAAKDLWTFKARVQLGDHLAALDTEKGVLHVGTVSSLYTFAERPDGLVHQREVRWTGDVGSSGVSGRTREMFTSGPIIHELDEEASKDIEWGLARFEISETTEDGIMWTLIGLTDDWDL